METPPPIPPPPEPVALASFRERALGFFYKAKRLLKEYGWVVMLGVVVFSSLFFWQAAVKGPYYVSRARLMLNSPLALPGNSAFQEDRGGYIGTQMNILLSSRVQDRAREMITNPLVCHVKFNVILEDSTVLKLTASGSEPSRVRAYLAAVIEAYQEFKRNARKQAAENTAAAIQNELAEAQTEISHTEKEKVEFQKSHNIAYAREQDKASRENLARLKTQLNDLSALCDLSRNADIDSLPADAEGMLSAGTLKSYRQLKSDLEAAELELAEFSQYMRPAHPKIIGLQGEILRLKNAREIYRRQSRASLSASRGELKNRIAQLNGVIAEGEKSALEFSRELAEFEALDGRLQRAQTLYEKLVSSAQEVDLSQKLATDLLGVLEEPTPARCSPGFYAKRALLGAIAGLFAGAAVLVLISLFDNRMVCLEELAAEIAFPVVGVIPAQKRKKKIPFKLISDAKARPAFVESYRHLRSYLACLKTPAPKVVSLVSSIPGEGKTSVAINLAIAFNSGGAKALVIDADLHKGRLHEILGLKAAAGLADILSGREKFDDCVVSYKRNLHVLSHGSAQNSAAESTTEIVSQERFSKLIASLRGLYDVILIDTPPILAAEDALLISPNADATLFIVRANFTQSTQTRAALGMMRQRGIVPTGIVFNGLDLKHPNYQIYKYVDSYQRPDAKTKI
jgi:capsular exopolysaccharide synthesis family protein